MHRLVVTAFAVWISAIVLSEANPLPLTANDIGLMLRSGYSNASVRRELAARHFVGELDQSAETGLLKAGASVDLINELKAGAYSLSAAETVKAQQKISDLAERRKADAEQAQTAQQQYQAQVARERSKATLEQKYAHGTSNFLQGLLVRYDKGAVVPAEEGATASKKLFLFYFSAHWCGPCRKFTPQLIDYYKRTVERHPEVEVVFYSFDRSPRDMEAYMRDANMPWLALDYGKRQERQNLAAKAGESIPALLLADTAGNILSSSVVDGKYVGPQKVLADLDSVLAGNQPRVAQGR